MGRRWFRNYCPDCVLHLHRFMGVPNFWKVPTNYSEQWPVLGEDQVGIGVCDSPLKLCNFRI